MQPYNKFNIKSNKGGTELTRVHVCAFLFVLFFCDYSWKVSFTSIYHPSTGKAVWAHVSGRGGHMDDAQ